MGETSAASARTGARLAGRGAGGGVGHASGRDRSKKRGHWGHWGRTRVMYASCGTWSGTWHLGASGGAIQQVLRLAPTARMRKTKFVAR